MKKIEAIIHPHLFDSVREALQLLGSQGLTISEVKGFSRPHGHIKVNRGSNYKAEFAPRVKIEAVIEEEIVEDAIEVIAWAARSGKCGGGKIVIFPVKEVICIRTGERGVRAV